MEAISNQNNWIAGDTKGVSEEWKTLILKREKQENANKDRGDEESKDDGDTSKNNRGTPHDGGAMNKGDMMKLLQMFQ